MTKSLLLLAALAASPACAQSPLADLAAIDRAVEAFTGLPQGAPGGAALPVDRRLRLAACRQPLALTWYGIRRDTVQVSCPAAGGWKLFVPLAANAPGAPAAPIVMRGDAVSITVAGDGFAVSQPGEALEGGAAGEWIKVRGAGAGAPVLRARVLRPGVVGIALP
ncbi:MAG: flagella basal body P-ring formation protein FlgA [Novosphingobium sp.]